MSGLSSTILLEENKKSRNLFLLGSTFWGALQLSPFLYKLIKNNS